MKLLIRDSNGNETPIGGGGGGSSIHQTSTLTLAANSWDSNTNQQTISLSSYNFKNDNRNVIDITLGEEQTWADCGVLPVSTATTTANNITYLSSITFECETAPESDLTFKVTSMEVS